MADQNERRALVPVMTAALALAIGIFFMWADLRGDAPSPTDEMVTSAVVTHAGAVLAPSLRPSDLVVPQTVAARAPERGF